MDFDWNKIGSGSKFNALVSAVLCQKDHRTHIFNRDGKDGAIDALSGDMKTVFQSKYHHGGSSAQAFTDAKKELKKIPAYRAAGHRWHAIWKDVTTWRLITNVPFGPQDELRWQNEVVPEFAKLGLAATYQTSAHLQNDLIKHRDIADAFFGDRPRLFVSLQEHREALLAREVLERAYDVPLEGRDAEMTRIRDFVQNSPHHVLLIEGEGGVGKSRLQYEAAVALVDEGVVDTVYCGTPHLPASQDWYVGIVPEANALVLIDDPTDADFVVRFLSELRSRTKAWKAVITVRSQRDPVIDCLRDPRERLLAPPIVLAPLAEAAAACLAAELLQSLPISDEDRPRAEKWIAKVCGRFPIWMTVAAKLLETRTDLRELPEDNFGIAEVHVADIVRHTKPEIAAPSQVLALLRWIALAQPVNRHADGVLAYLAAATGLPSAEAVDALLTDLVRRRALTFFGVSKRMVEIRPDVLRDHLLIEWLTFEEAGVGRRPSPDARRVATELAAEALEDRPSPFTERIVSSLARLEFTIESQPPFLDPLADAAVQLAESAGDTLAQQRALKVAKLIAPLRPRKLARVAELLRARDVPVGTLRTIFGEHRVTRSRVLDEVPWELFRAAHRAATKDERHAVLRELCEFVDVQAAEDGRRSNSGRSAAELLPRVLHGGRTYRSSFHEEGAALVADAMNRLARGETPCESWRVVVGAMTALQRMDTYTSSDEPNTFTWETFGIAPEGAPGKIAAQIRLRLWDVVTKPGPLTPAKKFAWPILDAMHRVLNQGDKIPEWHALEIDDLKRCEALTLDPATHLEDLQAARTLWDWHHQYDQDPVARPLADACEANYLKHPITARYAGVFGTDRLESEKPIEDAADAWPVTATAADLEEYLAGAFLYARTHADNWREGRVNSFLWQLGQRRGRDQGIRDFVAVHLARGSASELFPAALQLARASLFETRKLGDDAAVRAALEWLDGLVPDEASRARLLGALYPEVGRWVARAWTEADRDFMDKHWSLVEQMPPRSLFFVLGRRLHSENAMQTRITQLLAGLEGAARSDAVSAIWSGYNDMLPHPLTAADVSATTVDFLLGLMMTEPDLGEKHGHSDWEIGEILKVVPPKPVSWMVEVVRRRLEAFGPHNKGVEVAKSGQLVFILPGDDALLLRAVAPLPNEAPTPEAHAAVRELFAIAKEDATIGYYLPQLLAKLDPHGRVAPHVIAEKLQDVLDVPDAEAVRTWARFAGWRRHGSPAWRTIAIAACARVSPDWSDYDRNGVYSSLRSQRMKGWSGTPGELHPRFHEAVDTAKKALADEQEPILKQYWEWTLKVAEYDLERAKAKLEEGEDF